jgi:hypothetical protein
MADADEEQWGDAVGGEAPRPGSRASRSLGLLCARFLELYSATHICGESHLSLDHAATSLGVERRRMYDVVGILEACEVVVRRGKNSYTCAPRPCAASAPRLCVRVPSLLVRHGQRCAARRREWRRLQWRHCARRRERPDAARHRSPTNSASARAAGMASRGCRWRWTSFAAKLPRATRAVRTRTVRLAAATTRATMRRAAARRAAGAARAARTRASAC